MKQFKYLQRKEVKEVFCLCKRDVQTILCVSGREIDFKEEKKIKRLR